MRVNRCGLVQEKIESGETNVRTKLVGGDERRNSASDCNEEGEMSVLVRRERRRDCLSGCRTRFECGAEDACMQGCDQKRRESVGRVKG